MAGAASPLRDTVSAASHRRLVLVVPAHAPDELISAAIYRPITCIESAADVLFPSEQISQALAKNASGCSGTRCDSSDASRSCSQDPTCDLQNTNRRHRQRGFVLARTRSIWGCSMGACIVFGEFQIICKDERLAGGNGEIWANRMALLRQRCLQLHKQ